MLYHNNKKYLNINEWVGVLNKLYSKYDIRVQARDVHQLFHHYGLKPIKTNSKREKSANGTITYFSESSFNTIRYREDFMKVLYNIVTFGDARGKESVIPKQQENISAPISYKNDENNMEKYSQHLEKEYQIENSIKNMKKKIVISEGAFKRLFENTFDEGFKVNGQIASRVPKDFFKQTDQEINIDWDSGKDNKGKKSDANDTTKYNNAEEDIDEKDLTMHPTVVKMPMSKIDCYNLYKMNTTELQQVIKHKTWGVNGRKVNFDETKFINASVEYAQDLINNVAGRLKYNAMRYGEDENIEVGYITYPSSSSDFNDKFVNKLHTYFPNTKIVKDCFLKRRSGIGIDYEVAKYLNCDALDIALLEGFIADADAKDKTIQLREQVEGLVDKISNDLNGHIYNYTTKNDYIPYTKNKKTIAFNKDSNEIENFDEIDEKEMQTLNKLTELMLNINREYGNLENAYNEIEKRRQENVRNKKYANLKHDNETFLSTQTKYTTTLDNTLNDRSVWQIKKQSEYARRILRNLFMLDDNKWIEMEKDKENKIVVIFDDNLAGGATMDNVCYTLIERNWKYIIPLTLAVMPISTGVDIKSAAKQSERDKYSEKSLLKQMKDNRVEKRLSYDYADGETVHNINKVFFDKDYDYDNVSTYGQPYGAIQKPQKFKGRRPTGNFTYQGVTFSSQNIVDRNSAEEALRKRFPNRNFRDIDRKTQEMLKLSRMAKRKLDRFQQQQQ